MVGIGATVDFTCFISDSLPDLQGPAKVQCFPLYLYDAAPSAPASGGLFSSNAEAQVSRDRREAISDAGLGCFQLAYPAESISKEDVFYYVYGLLHSPDYRERFADNLSKELPRIPCVKAASDFWAFATAGRDLAELHLGYEKVKPFPATLKTRDRSGAGLDFRVEKMKVPKVGKTRDLTTLVYNSTITVTGIPPEAYEYVVNGKAALDWIIERQCAKTDKDSGIVNDANDWATETVSDPRYPLDLFLRVVTVSLETLKIVRGLPNLDI